MIYKSRVKEIVNQYLDENEIKNADVELLLKKDLENIIYYILYKSNSIINKLPIDLEKIECSNNFEEDLFQIEEYEKVKSYIPFSLQLMYLEDNYSEFENEGVVFPYLFQETINSMGKIDISNGKEAYILIFCMAYFETLSNYMNLAAYYKKTAIDLMDYGSTYDYIEYLKLKIKDKYRNTCPFLG